MAASGFFTKMLDEKNRGPLLTMIGVLLVVFSMGNLEVGDSFKFIPSQDVSGICLYLAVAIGVLLVFTGVALILHQKNILQSLLRKFFFFCFSIVLITTIGIIAGMRYLPGEKPDVLQCYSVNRTSFHVYVSFWKIRDYVRNAHNKTLVIAYRKQDPALLFEDDPYMRTRRFSISEKDMETLLIPFPFEFSERLTSGADMVEFALWLCPQEIDLAKITTSQDLKNQGGILLETASAMVQQDYRWSGRHCPQFLAGK
jgi:hypothetical protein